MLEQEKKPKMKRQSSGNIFVTMVKPPVFTTGQITLEIDKPIALYGRQSSLFQVINNTDSHDYQIEEQKKHILAYGWKEERIIEYFQDFKVSGTLGIGERIGITKLTEDIENNSIRTVYVQLEDRLFRDKHLENVTRFSRICHDHNVVIITSYRMYQMAVSYEEEAFVEACKQAWKAYDYQINMRMLPMRAYASHRGNYDARPINIGYIVERDKHRPFYKKYVIDPVNGKRLVCLAQRFIELGGDAVALNKELEATPGPHFLQLSDPKLHSKVNLKVVEGGYRISDKETIIRIFRNKVYLGVWVTGGVEYPDNHDALFDAETFATIQYLLDRREGPRKSRQRRITNGDSVIRGLVLKPNGYIVSVEPYYNRIVFSRKSTENAIYARDTITIPFQIVEEMYKDIFEKRVSEDRDLARFSSAMDQAYEEETQRKEHLAKRIAELQKRHDSLYHEVIQDRLQTDPSKKLPESFVLAMLKEGKELEASIKELQVKSTEPSEKKVLPIREITVLMAEVKNGWETVPFAHLKKLCNILTRGISLKPLSAHFWSFSIEWEMWGIDTGVIWLYDARWTLWSDESLSILKSLNARQAKKEEYIEAFPSYSPAAIFGKCKKLGLKKPFPRQEYNVEFRLSLRDREVVTQKNIDVTKFTPKRDVVFFLEHFEEGGFASG